MDPVRHFRPLIDRGQLETFRIERSQIAKHIASAFQDLREAEKTFPVPDRAAYLFAYTAMLKMGRALLFLKGYRSKGKAQHETVVEAAGQLLGSDFKSLTERFDRMRKKRNKMIYDVGDLISHSDAEEAFCTAGQYLGKVRSFMEKEDPQLRLDFESKESTVDRSGAGEGTTT